MHIVKEGMTNEGQGRYRAVLTVGDRPAEMETPQRELLGEQEVMEFIQRLLDRPAQAVRPHVDELQRNGRVRLEDVDEDWYKKFDRAA